MNPKPGQLTDILFKVVLGLLITTLFVVVVLVLSGKDIEPISREERQKQSINERISDLNATYVIVYPSPIELPEGVNLTIDTIKFGENGGKDTIWLMPDNESAGY